MYISSFCKLMRINVFLFSQQISVYLHKLIHPNLKIIKSIPCNSTNISLMYPIFSSNQVTGISVITENFILGACYGLSTLVLVMGFLVFVWVI